MKKVILSIILAVGLALSALAADDVKFKDVPNDYWAAPAVYDLVKMGITKGYPDGTFRGNKPITRYEAAIFLSKLARSIGGDELKTEIKSLRDEVASLKSGQDNFIVNGRLQANWKFGNLLSRGAPQGGAADYRLIITANRRLSDKADLKINFDTMDFGYMNDGRASVESLATQLLDLESNLKLNYNGNPVDLKLTYGPGPVQHTADPTGFFPSEVGVVYERPNPSAIVSTSLGGLNLSGGYIVPRPPVTGKINVSRLTGSAGYAFERVLLLNNIKFELTGDYLSSGIYSASTRDIRAKIDLIAPLADRIEASGTVGFGGSDRKTMMVSGGVALKDLWDTGTVANIQVAKIGSEFISTDPAFSAAEFDFAGLDPFNRPLENGTFNLGGEITQNVSDDFRLIGRGALRLDGNYQYQTPKGRLTAEGGISYTVAPNADFNALYRLHQDKVTNDTTDLASLGLVYHF